VKPSSSSSSSSSCTTIFFPRLLFETRFLWYFYMCLRILLPNALASGFVVSIP
jgi:hypothetical protein